MAMPARILLVEHNPYNLELLSTLLEKEGYLTLGVTTLEAFDQALANAPIIHLALVDIDGFDRGIWLRCEALHARGIPLLVIAPGTSLAGRGESYRYGARGVLIKPLVTREVVTAIASLLEGSA
ncbi:MAG: Polar-differentiation response regulator DivK [bacterium ADurb.Bin429]|nr:MAG: Polar-differentiation response regulator DivK [bacterium ADurb.Bin429]